MRNALKYVFGIVTILLSIVAGALGCGFVGGSDFAFTIRFLFMTIFILQALFTTSLTIELFRKNKKS